MDMPVETIVLVALVGAGAGWLGHFLSEEPGFGRGGDVIAGLVGAFAGALAAPALGIDPAGALAVVVTALVGAAIVVAGARFLADVWESQRSPRADANGRPLPPAERADAAPALNRSRQPRISEAERARLWMRKS